NTAGGGQQVTGGNTPNTVDGQDVANNPAVVVGATVGTVVGAASRPDGVEAEVNRANDNEGQEAADNEQPSLREQITAEAKGDNDQPPDREDLPVLADDESAEVAQPVQPVSTVDSGVETDGDDRDGAAVVSPGDGRDEVPAGLGAVVDSQARDQVEVDGDGEGSVRQLAEELRQVGAAKDEGLIQQPEIVIDPAPKEGDDDGASDEAPTLDSSGERPVLMSDKPEVEAAGGKAGLVAELRQGRVDD
ncbi:MAG: hypothetical protein GY934_21345, partial [Gammaproteobacteria bacterium]|nr:hypothetical protein [Gammaproteobacteria bacterium]